MRDTMRRMGAAQTTSELWTRAAQGMRAITGYDRVDISYNHPDGHGEVVASAQADELDSHLGIHFSEVNVLDEPSGVFRTKQSRIVLGRRENVALLAASGYSASNLDLTTAVLSAPSSRDLALLDAFGYGSTFFIAVVRNDRLLGLINCGNRTERPLPYALRDALELLANQLALQFDAMQEIHRLKQREAVRQVRAELIAQVADGGERRPSLSDRQEVCRPLVPT